MSRRGTSCIGARKLDGGFDCFGTRITEIDRIKTGRHTFYQLLRQRGGKRRRVEADPAGKLRIQYLLQRTSNDRMAPTKIKDSPVCQEIEVFFSGVIP